MRRLLPFLLASCSLVLPGGDQAPAGISPAEWLARGVSLNDSEQSITAKFGLPPSRLRSGDLTTLSFFRDPAGVAHSHSDGEAHVHEHGEADACNLQPAWSIHSRHGRIQSIVANPETPQPLQPLGKLGLTELASGTSGGLRLKAWRVREGQALIAVGVDARNASAGQWVLIREELIPQIYPALDVRTARK